MPPKVRITRGDIVDTAIQLIKQNGKAGAQGDRQEEGWQRRRDGAAFADPEQENQKKAGGHKIGKHCRDCRPCNLHFENKNENWVEDHIENAVQGDANARLRGITL